VCGRELHGKKVACTYCIVEYNIKHGKTTNQALHKYLIKQRGYKCEHCGLTDWMGKPIPLEAHHKDGDHNNNSDQNLELICLNCHGHTHNYRGKNSHWKKKPKTLIYNDNKDILTKEVETICT
jgi:hypothetical protein